MSYFKVVPGRPSLTPAASPLPRGPCVGRPRLPPPRLSEPDSSLPGTTCRKTAKCVFWWQVLFRVFENFLNQGNKTLNKLLLCLPGAVHINILIHQRSQIHNSDSNANH